MVGYSSQPRVIPHGRQSCCCSLYPHLTNGPRKWALGPELVQQRSRRRRRPQPRPPRTPPRSRLIETLLCDGDAVARGVGEVHCSRSRVTYNRGLTRKLATFTIFQKFGENRFCRVTGQRIYILILATALKCTGQGQT